jgi:4-hydroxybenzoyl-CoA thioesterase
MAFRAPLTVRFGDVDPAGIVYYPRLLHFCHVAMEDFFGAVLGRRYADVIGQERLGYPAIRLEVDFRRPVRYGDEVEIEVEIVELGTTAITWRFAIFHRDAATPACEVRTVTVGVDLDSFAKRPVPEWIRQHGPA